MNSFKRAPRNDGFVLFEVLVSAAILSAGCLVLVEALQGSVRAARRVEDSYEAALTTSNMLWMLDRSRDQAALPGVMVPGSLPSPQWTIEERPWDNPSLSGAFDVETVTLRWQSADKAGGSFSLSGYYPHEQSTGS